MKHQWRHAAWTALSGLVLGACVGGGSDGRAGDGTEGRFDALVVPSDGTPGGDLAELEMRHSQRSCQHAWDLVRDDSCWGNAWPDGAYECVYDAVNQNIAGNEEAIACVVAAHEAQIVCLDDDWVIPGTCWIAFDEATSLCPAVTAELRRPLSDCPRDPWDDVRSWVRDDAP